jgi:MFS transporter, DHA1 family, tetracycline resistance protein
MKQSPLVILFFTVFIDLVGFGIVLPLLPTYARELGASPLEIGLVAGAYSLMQFFFSPIWGGISDRIGRRPVILFSVATSVFSYFIFSQATTLLLLFISRMLAGIGSANVSATQAYITDISTPEERSKKLGIIGAAFGLGFVLGPPIGGLIKTHFGIVYVGYTASVLTLLDLILAYFLLPESLKVKKPHAQFKFFNPDAFTKAFAKPELARLMIINFCFVFAFVNMQISVPLLWQEHYDQNEASVGYLFALIGIISVIIQGGLIGKITQAIGERKTLVWGTIIMFFGITGLPFVPQGMLVGAGLLVLAAVAVGNGLCTPTNTALISLYTSPDMQGETLGIAQSIGSIGRILGPLSGSLLYGLEYHTPYLAGGVFLIAATLLSTTMFRYELHHSRQAI